MVVEAFGDVFSLEAWFDRWLEALGPPCMDAAPPWPGGVRRLILEALSDASPEQFLNPLLASHLRHLGRQRARDHAPDHVFWVRSEWQKVDLSYGLAAPFELSKKSWNRAWTEGLTGDLGQCEVKVCYAHSHANKMKTLAGQLENRRERDRASRAPGLDRLRYHGLVLLFEHGGMGELRNVGTKLEAAAEGLGLTTSRPFAYPNAADECGRLWPSTGTSDYRCGLALGLFELTA